MNRLILPLTALLLLGGHVAAQGELLPEDPAPSQDLPVDEGQDGPAWDNGLVWGLGLGGLGLAAAAGIAWFLGVGGLRHIDESNVLEHPMRRSLLDQVEASPGVHLRELANRHGTAVTNTQWHLRKLEMAGLIKTEKVQGRRLYYPTRGGVAVKEQAIKNAAVQNPNAQRILDHLAAHPGCNQRTMADALEMNPGTVRWHLRKMESASLVKSIQDGAQVCYFVVESSPAARRPARPAREKAVEAPNSQS